MDYKKDCDFVDALPAVKWTDEEIRSLDAEVDGFTELSPRWLFNRSMRASATGDRAKGRSLIRKAYADSARIGVKSPWWEVAHFALPAFYALDFDLIDEILADWLGWPSTCSVRIRHEQPVGAMYWGFYWSVLEGGENIFQFNPTVFAGNRHGLMDRLIRLLPFLADISRSARRVAGRTCVWWSDIATRPGLGFSSKSPDVYLIPDVEFIASCGYRDFKADLTAPKWGDRKDQALWRGTLWKNIAPGGWRAQLRTKLCEMTLFPESAGVLDAAFSDCPKDVAEEVAHAGLMRNALSAENMAQFKYLIDVDGYSNAWSGLFRKLVTGSAVLKVMSDYRQWYYDRLIPWHNFVPVSHDLHDLLQAVLWLRANDDAAREIGENGRKLAMSMSYDAELAAVKPSVERALRDGLGWSPAD